jgi:uncharacterized protein YodC (DUF2158 family)
MNPGDVVYLKSGGPAMTVGCIEMLKMTQSGPLVAYAVVSWFAGKESCTKQFPVTSLTKTDPTV